MIAKKIWEIETYSNSYLSINLVISFILNFYFQWLDGALPCILLPCDWKQTSTVKTKVERKKMTSCKNLKQSALKPQKVEDKLEKSDISSKPLQCLRTNSRIGLCSLPIAEKFQWQKNSESSVSKLYINDFSWLILPWRLLSKWRY